ncbi:beta-propeller fold lactonase family protein [Mycobacterium crocinum]|uniref:Beta-propeller fold lactonase family protein n=1 Tax=Mycolicibacterium crocinum TaxID=388459 RepID=A0ABY3TTE1_9MYCO|nr:beta-propeller fold lactonase family protein [Mycolicibacterium crocinum]MCV7219260.1 beta-propeller fold lactonase family protein [Mycolicibacterium crocinum]ULN43289.1 beta-propeller fold lactonase family protein [Mycolicibacterium crocinum]
MAVQFGGQGLVLTPDGKRLYTVDETGGTVSVVNTETNQRIGAPIAVGSHPLGIAISRDGTRIYVTNGADGTVSVIDTDTNTVVSTFGVVADPNELPRAVTVGADGKFVYVARNGGNTVAVVDTTSEQVVDTITVGPQPSHVLVSPDGSKLYVASIGTVTVVDTATHDVITSTLVTPGADRMAISPDGTRLYVTTMGDGGVAVIDTTDYSTVTTIPAVNAGNSGGIAISPDGTRLYVASYWDQSQVLVIDTATNTVVDTLPVSDSTQMFLAVSPDNARLFVTVNGGMENSGTAASDASSAWFYNSVGTLAQRGANGIRNIVGDRGNPRQPDAGNSQKEIDWENNWEVFNLYTGWAPGWGTFINGVSLGLDIGQMVNAVGRGDRDDIADEFGDITSDLIGLIPVVGGFGATAAKEGISYAAGEVASGVAHVVDDAAYAVGEWSYNAGQAVQGVWNWLTGK